MKNTITTAEKRLAIDSLKVRRAMNLDCFNITNGSRREHYRECLAKIDAELAELTSPQRWPDQDRIQMHIEAEEGE